MSFVDIAIFMRINTLIRGVFLFLHIRKLHTNNKNRGDGQMAQYDEIQVHEKPPLRQSIPLGIQHLFAMFGSTVLVPILFGVNPATILLMNGIGTIIYLFITKGQIPTYLGSSFAFISPVLVVLGKHNGIDGYGYVLGGFLMVGIVLTVVGIIIKFAGTSWIDVIFPPAAMGAIVAVIGLELVPTAAEMAGWIAPADAGADWTMDPASAIVSLLTLLITIIFWVTMRGFLKIIPILLGIISGYIIAYFFGLLQFDLVEEATWITMPEIYTMKLDWSAVRSEEHTSELQSRGHLVCRLLLEKKKKK